MDIMEVLEHLPQRYPFLLVDRVVAIEPGKSIHAYKNVSINEPHFVGHFPNYPVMPGVLIMEALAQAAGILAFKTAGEKPTPNSLFFFAGIDEARAAFFAKCPGGIVHSVSSRLSSENGVFSWRSRVHFQGICSAAGPAETRVVVR